MYQDKKSRIIHNDEKTNVLSCEMGVRQREIFILPYFLISEMIYRNISRKKI